MILLIWAAPALLLAAFATGAVRATRTAAALCTLVAVLIALTAIPSINAARYCDIGIDCPSAGSALLAAAFTIGAMLIAHVLGRWVRDAFDRLEHAGHVGHSG